VTCCEVRGSIENSDLSNGSPLALAAVCCAKCAKNVPRHGTSPLTVRSACDFGAKVIFSTTQNAWAVRAVNPQGSQVRALVAEPDKSNTCIDFGETVDIRVSAVTPSEGPRSFKSLHRRGVRLGRGKGSISQAEAQPTPLQRPGAGCAEAVSYMYASRSCNPLAGAERLPETVTRCSNGR
jgi:hypothetical protein